MKAATPRIDFPNLVDATRVEPQPGAAGRYLANLSTAWDAPVHPSGGVVSAIALRDGKCMSQLRATVRNPGSSEAPSVDLNMNFFADTEQDCLLAFATQMMLIRFLDPAELGAG